MYLNNILIINVEMYFQYYFAWLLFIIIVDVKVSVDITYY